MAQSQKVSFNPGYKKPSFFKLVAQNKTLLLMCLPAVVFFFIFSYMPMPGAYIAFTNFQYNKGIWASPFVGLQNFKFLFTSGQLTLLLRNTILYNVAFIVLGNFLQLLFAILLNELRGKVFKSAVQTISYIPHFLSVVVICSMLNGFGSTTGLFNDIRDLLGMARVDMNNGSQYFLPLYLGSQVWQTVGWSSIMYLSALSNVDVTLYDVANIDGANRWQKIKNIIWPTIKPTTTILLIMNLGNVLNSDYTKILLMQNDTNRSQLEVIGTFVYQKGIVEGKFSYATAVNLFISVIGFALVFGANMITRKINPENSLW